MASIKEFHLIIGEPALASRRSRPDKANPSKSLKSRNLTGKRCTKAT
jgi:hypothetical protein